jgi:biopolymer transport protein ExbD
MKINLDSSEPDVRIEIVPLIDVIFCILTFFILAAVTLTRQTAINVDLPRASTGTTQMRKLLIVTVDPIGQTYVEKQPVSRDQLYQALTSFRQASPDGTMVLYASRAASYNDVVQVLDLLHSVGGDRVALATLPGTGTDAGGASTIPFSTEDGSISIPGLNPNSTNPDRSTLPSTLPTFPDSSAPSSTSPYNLSPASPGSTLPSQPSDRSRSLPGSSNSTPSQP